ncbi:hypothetical protein V6N11_055077 [Hibiscus sabdariffa]|uniref:Uncharacterized protein n=1 Tax=Hibiscus sabdariffa TaxID=183260 RepID=A0ABR1ZQN6_9ROSI
MLRFQSPSPSVCYASPFLLSYRVPVFIPEVLYVSMLPTFHVSYTSYVPLLGCSSHIQSVLRLLYLELASFHGSYLRPTLRRKSDNSLPTLAEHLLIQELLESKILASCYSAISASWKTTALLLTYDTSKTACFTPTFGCYTLRLLRFSSLRFFFFPAYRGTGKNGPPMNPASLSSYSPIPWIGSNIKTGGGELKSMRLPTPYRPSNLLSRQDKSK